jgi:hypothetical protein
VTDMLPSGRVMYGKPPELDCSGAAANSKAQCLQIAAAIGVGESPIGRRRGLAIRAVSQTKP